MFNLCHISISARVLTPPVPIHYQAKPAWQSSFAIQSSQPLQHSKSTLAAEPTTKCIKLKSKTKSKVAATAENGNCAVASSNNWWSTYTNMRAYTNNNNKKAWRFVNKYVFVYITRYLYNQKSTGEPLAKRASNTTALHNQLQSNLFYFKINYFSDTLHFALLLTTT